MDRWLRWTCVSGVALLVGVALFGAGYVVGSVAPLPWLRGARAVEPQVALQPTLTPPPPSATPSPTPVPSATLPPTFTPFPTPTERAVTPQPTRNATLPTATEPQVEAAFGALREAWTLIHAEYLNRPIDDVKLVQGALRGMVRTLDDPFSGYNDPEEFRRLNDDLSGQYEGIGIEVAEKDGRIVIIAPISGSPAEKAGLRPGDVIVRIDDKSLAGMSVTDIGGLVRGSAGTTVRVSVQRSGTPETLEVSITRARIQTRNVDSLEMPDYAREAGIMGIKLANFGPRSAADMRDALRLAMAPNPKGLILDLRGNPGGSLFAAIDIVSQFIGDGVVMLEEDAEGKRQTYTARPNGLATRAPLVVLIDKGSASASEIVAGAIKDRGRGTLVGETTFGKGTVQDWHQLANDQGGVRLTIARWLTPKGTWVHGQGIAPDIYIPRTADDRTAGRDPQLERAIQHLLGTVR